MAKLILMLDGDVLNDIALDKERMTIGRRSSNDIQIDNLAVSGQHAEISVLGKDIYIADLNSTNGTLVNSKAITKHALQHNDVIEFGKYQLTFIDETALHSTSGDGFADTVLVKPPVKNSETAKQVTAEVKSPEVKREPTQIIVEENIEANSAEENTKQDKKEARFKILNGEKAGQDLLLDKTMIKVGTPGEQLAVITKRQQGFFISHIAGDTHPLVNGQSIGMQAYVLKEGDQVEVQGIKMTLYLA